MEATHVGIARRFDSYAPSGASPCVHWQPVMCVSTFKCPLSQMGCSITIYGDG